MASFEPPEKFIEQSRARLTKVFQQEFDKKSEIRQKRAFERNAASHLLRKLAENEETLETKLDIARAEFLDRCKVKLAPPVSHTFKPRNDSSPNTTDITFTPTYTWPWSWSATTGEGTIDELKVDNTTGNMDFMISGLNDGTASAAVAVGSFFQPTTTNGLMHVSSNPSIRYAYGNWAFLSHSHTHAYIGLYVGQYTLGGDFVQAVVDQRIQLWDMTTDHDFSGSNSGFPLTASVPVDDVHFYEIWVWIGGDAEAGSFWHKPFSYGKLFVLVPSISIHVY